MDLAKTLALKEPFWDLFLALEGDKVLVSGLDDFDRPVRERAAQALLGVQHCLEHPLAQVAPPSL